MLKPHWLIRLLRAAALLLVVFGCLVVFIYTPFYSKFILKGLNYFVPVEVNQVAAQSQQQAALTEHEVLEPGSDLWIARQAYLAQMDQALKENNVNKLKQLEVRYKELQAKLSSDELTSTQLGSNHDSNQDNNAVAPASESTEENTGAKQTGQSSLPSIESVAPTSEQAQILTNKDIAPEILQHAENRELMQQYIDFLNRPVHVEAGQTIDAQTSDDINQLQQNQKNVTSPAAKPYAIVVLGGGLTLDENRRDIVVNRYTRLRLEKTLELHQQNRLPIVLSGVEAPYMQAWLKERGVNAKLLENRSMNTCENTRFSSLLLQKQGGAPTVILVTDMYHMPRTRRLFALSGIETLPVEAPLPTKLSAWRPSQNNYDHSRRANYELLATIRDVLFGSSGCREVP